MTDFTGIIVRALPTDDGGMSVKMRTQGGAAVNMSLSEGKPQLRSAILAARTSEETVTVTCAVEGALEITALRGIGLPTAA